MTLASIPTGFMILRTGAATFGLALSNWPQARAADARKKILFFSKSSGFEHSTIKRKGGKKGGGRKP